MLTPSRLAVGLGLVVSLAAAPVWLVAQQPQGQAPPPGAAPGRGQGGRGQFPGGTNPDGSLRPTAPVRSLFTQEAYTEYEILAPGSESFRIRYLPEESRAGATELVNATRGGSEGSDIQVFDPRTGKPLEVTYGPDPKDPQTHSIHAKFTAPVPEGGIGRVLVFKT